MKYLSPLTDPVFVKPAYETNFDRLFKSWIRDERDLPFVYLTLKITFTLWPLAIILYLPGIDNWLWWAAAITYQFLNNFTFKGPFGLMLHCTSHRVFFKTRYQFWNNYLPWVIGPLFGQTPESYYAHHIGMHHPENNMEQDDSSTLMYQRDSLQEFLIYLWHFVTLGAFNTARYHIRKNRKKLMVKLVRGEILFIAACVGLAFINLPATFVVFILPFIISRVIMMVGNWAQHAFICQEEPGNSYKNSITCINTKYNHKCWNDGYHSSHHIKPNLHWTEHPVYFNKMLKEYIDNDAIVFDSIHFLHVWAYLMGKRYDLLAKHFVNIGNRFQSDTEIISFLKQRTRRITIIPASIAITG